MNKYVTKLNNLKQNQFLSTKFKLMKKFYKDLNQNQLIFSQVEQQEYQESSNIRKDSYIYYFRSLVNDYLPTSVHMSFLLIAMLFKWRHRQKKNIFKLSQGQYIAPEKVQNVYARCKYYIVLCFWRSYAKLLWNCLSKYGLCAYDYKITQSSRIRQSKNYAKMKRQKNSSFNYITNFGRQSGLNGLEIQRKSNLPQSHLFCNELLQALQNFKGTSQGKYLLMNLKL